jgi:predicted amidohydrolase
MEDFKLLTYNRISLFFTIILIVYFLTIIFSCSAAEIKGEAKQLVAVQMKLNIDDFYSQQSFEKKIEGLMREVADKIDAEYPVLVVFPEDVGLMLIALEHQQTLSTAQTIEDAIKKMTMKYFLPLVWYRLRYNISWVPALYYYRSKAIAQAYFDTFSSLAEKYQAYIVAGSIPLPHYQMSNGEVLYQEGALSPEIYNSSYLFGPDGKVIGFQDKVHLLELEQEGGLHLTPGKLEDIKVFDTKIGRLGIAVCLDSFQEDVIDKLREQEADILIQPSANPLLWEEWQQEEWLESSYKFTYESGYFKCAINPMMNGEFFDLSFYGQSSIISRENTDNLKNYFDLEPQKGFLVISDSDDKEEILVAEIELP